MVHSYSTEDNTLKFYSEVKTKAPSKDWIPTSMKLGKSKVIIGSKKSQPFILLNLVTGKFETIMPNFNIKKPENAEV